MLRALAHPKMLAFAQRCLTNVFTCRLPLSDYTCYLWPVIEGATLPIGNWIGDMRDAPRGMLQPNARPATHGKRHAITFQCLSQV